MSDEWLEHRSLRGRRPGQREEITRESLPRLRDAEGELRPLDLAQVEVLAEIVEESERGEKPADLPPDWVPRFQTSSGEFMRLTSEHIEQLKAQMAAEQAEAERAALAEPDAEADMSAKDGPGFRPRLRTSTGEIQRLSQGDLERLRNEIKVAESVKGSGIPAPDLPEIETAPEQFEALTPERIEAAWRQVLEEQQALASAPKAPAAEAPPSYRDPQGQERPLSGPAIDLARRQLEAHESGEGPRDWVPMFTTSTGDFERMTLEALEQLAEKERERRAVARAQLDLSKPLLVEQPGRRVLQDSDYDTPTGRFARVPREDEAIDAGWVRELNDEATMSTPGPIPATPRPKPQVIEGPPSQTLLYLERIRTGMRPWQVALVALILLGVGTLLFVPGRLLPLGLGGPVATPTAPIAPSTPVPTATLAPLTPGADPLGPYAVGRVAYASNRSGNYEIYVLDLAARTAQQLTNHPGDDRQPGWSPDGTRLAFVSDRDGDADIWVMNLDGSSLIQVTSDPSSVDNHPRWSPDGTLIVFSRETAGGSLLLAIPANCLSAPGTCESQAVTLVDSFARQAAFSPDGAQIAFTGGTFAGLPTAIHISGRNGGEPRVLEGSGATDSSPAWSSDGGLLAFVTNALGGPDLWLMRPDGSDLRPLTAEDASDVDPAWGPRGTVILFATDRNGDFDLALISTACLDPEEGCEDALIYLTSGEGSDINPAWWLPPGS